MTTHTTPLKWRWFTFDSFSFDRRLLIRNCVRPTIRNGMLQIDDKKLKSVGIEQICTSNAMGVVFWLCWLAPFQFYWLEIEHDKVPIYDWNKKNGAFIVMNVLVSVNYKCNTECTITTPSIHQQMYCSVANEMFYRIPMINDDVFRNLFGLILLFTSI